MIEIYKKRYQTCLESLEELRRSNTELQNETMSYAGVLDPMAEGILPILVGKEENRDRVRFTEAEKEYEVSILLGISTDTFDLLGLIKDFILIGLQNDEVSKVHKYLINTKGKISQTVPMFSNKKVNGKALWVWGRQGIYIEESNRPVNMVELLDIEDLGKSVISKQQLSQEIEEMSKNITIGFRLEEVVKGWQEFISKTELNEWQRLDFRMYVSKGFYVRKWVEDAAKILGVPMMVYTLKRTKVIHL